MRKLHILAAAAAMTASSLFADVQIGKGLSVGGYLDMTFQNASQEPAAGGPSTDTTSFNVANAEIDFKMDFGGGLTAQVDLDTTGVVGSSPVGSFGGVDVEQARIDYGMGQGTLTVGLFDTFIGLEGLEAPDLYQFSNSMTFATEPTQHEGLLYSWDNGKFNIAGAIVNSLSPDNSNANGPDELSYAFHLGFTPSEAISVNLNYGTEDTGSVANADFDLLTVDASYSNHGWTVGAEYVSLENDGVGASEFTGYMLMVNYMFTEQFGLTGRYSTLEDDTGAATTPEANEFTLAASYAVTPNWSALIEYRTEEIDAGFNVLGVGGVDPSALGNGLAGVDADIITLETILTF